MSYTIKSIKLNYGDEIICRLYEEESTDDYYVVEFPAVTRTTPDSIEYAAYVSTASTSKININKNLVGIIYDTLDVIADDYENKFINNIILDNNE